MEQYSIYMPYLRGHSYAVQHGAAQHTNQLYADMSATLDNGQQQHV